MIAISYLKAATRTLLLASLLFGTTLAQANENNAAKKGGNPIRETTRAIGHATVKVTREIGHASRKTVKKIGHTSRDTVKGVKKELKSAE